MYPTSSPTCNDNSTVAELSCHCGGNCLSPSDDNPLDGIEIANPWQGTTEKTADNSEKKKENQIAFVF